MTGAFTVSASNFVLASTAFVLPNARLLVADAPNTPKRKEEKPMRLRDKKVSFWLTENEQKQMKKMIYLTHHTQSDFIRRAIFGIKIYPKMPENFYDLLKEINRIGINVNQIAKLANSNGYVTCEQINALDKKLDEIIELVRGVE